MNMYKGKSKNEELRIDYSEAIICWLTIIAFFGMLAIHFIK